MWNSNPVILSDDRCEVTNKEQLICGILAAPEKADDASLRVAAVDPSETAAVKVELVQGALAAIKGIQVSHPSLQRRVTLIAEEVPVEACFVIPLRPLAEVVAHE